MRRCPPLEPRDGAGKAIHLLRERGLAAAPVVDDGGRLVGMVREEDLIRLAAPDWGVSEPESVRTAALGGIMRPVDMVLTVYQDVGHAVEAFKHSSEPVLPVVCEEGRYVGVVSRSDVMHGLFSRSMPRTVGGLATPLGVYLTTGNVRAGPGNPGLVLAGAALTAIYVVARLLVNLAAWAVQEKFPQLPLLSLRLSGDMGYFGPGFVSWNLALSGAELLLFFLVLRLSPISAIHASEHKVVNAIENGEELTPESVGRMPRVHARCGTNLMTALFMAFAVAVILNWAAARLGLTGPEPLVVAAAAIFIVVVVARTRVGPLLQSLVTTKEPSPRLLMNGLRAGRQLLERYQSNPARGAGRLRRVWNMGLLQAAAGFAATAFVVWLVSARCHLGLWP